MSKFWGLFIRGSWQSFCSVDPQTMADGLKSVLEELGYEYSFIVGRMGSEAFMLGSKRPPLMFKIKKPQAFNVKVIHARADPVVRIAFSIFGTSASLIDISVVQMWPLNRETKPYMRAMVQRIVGKLPREPWNLAHHPRFRTATVSYTHLTLPTKA